jgi:hypothetical protein
MLHGLLRARSRSAAVAPQLGDLGHPRAADDPADAAAMARDALAFLDAQLKPGSRARAPARGAR